MNAIIIANGGEEYVNGGGGEFCIELVDIFIEENKVEKKS